MVRFCFILKNPMYLDEGIYLSWAQLIGISKNFAYTSLQDGKTPLFFWLLHYFGSLIKNYLLAGRLISIISGLITAISWMLIFSKKNTRSIFYLFLFLIAPYGFLIERMALTDSLLVALSSFSLMLIIKGKNILEKKENTKYIYFFILMIFSGISLGFAYATKTTAKLFLVTYLLIILFWIFSYFLNKKYKKLIFIILGTILLFLFYSEVVNCFRTGGQAFWISIKEKEKLMIYSPEQIINRLVNNPLSSFTYAKLFFDYLLNYVSFLLIFIIVGLFNIVKEKKNRKFIWLIFSFLFISVSVCLSGKVMSSRYIYLTYPTLIGLAVFGLEYLISLKKTWLNFAIVLIFILTINKSLLLVFNFEKASYSQDDQSYLVSGNLTNFGLKKVINYFDNKEKNNVLIGINGSWGIPEGSSIILKENNLNSIILKKEEIIEKKESINNSCPKTWLKKDNFCLKLNFKQEENIDKYLYLVGGKEMVDNLSNFNFTEIYEFKKNKGNNSNYFLKIN